MHRIVIFICALVLTLPMLSRTSEPGKASVNMEKMKSLVGVWEGKDEQGKPIKVTYKLVSGGGTLMETIDHDMHKDGMITVYHLDGEAMMMTHYCSMGNQPRMRAVGGDASAITFAFVDGTNMKLEDPHMHKLTITWKDDNHVVQEWTMQAEGKDTPPVVFALERKG
ncbi:MAG: uncharacterized protein HW407_2288 [Bacteroidetes bacterium]|nr:uncharacterized protein [Bacteroidota bacterium]